MLKYPPFYDIIMFGISGQIEKNVKEIAYLLYENLKKYDIKGILLKPMPAPIDKIKNKYRWRIIIKANLDDDLIENINEILEKYYAVNKNNKTRVIVDIKPNNLL